MENVGKKPDVARIPLTFDCSDETQCMVCNLLKSAGYAFSDGSKRDWIVRYCLEHKIYNINQVNTLLFEYDQEQLGA